MPSVRLGNLWSMRATQALLKDERWSFVVLQEQSLLPLTAPGLMRESIRTIDAAVRQNGARKVLYMSRSGSSRRTT
ncbi:MAG: hypothetical protein HY854_04040 [Burkholderiales bacterium]|nr:hypothetical protein [Burkholderiales bacterium]